jgi:hypothetical protein
MYPISPTYLIPILYILYENDDEWRCVRYTLYYRAIKLPTSVNDETKTYFIIRQTIRITTYTYTRYAAVMILLYVMYIIYPNYITLSMSLCIII